MSPPCPTLFYFLVSSFLQLKLKQHAEHTWVAQVEQILAAEDFIGTPAVKDLTRLFTAEVQRFIVVLTDLDCLQLRISTHYEIHLHVVMYKCAKVLQINLVLEYQKNMGGDAGLIQVVMRDAVGATVRTERNDRPRMKQCCMMMLYAPTIVVVSRDIFILTSCTSSSSLVG